MATLAEFEKAFAGGADNIVVRSSQGKDYWLHRDQLQYLPGDLIYGVPLKKHPRARHSVVWLYPEKTTIIGEMP